MSYIDIAYSITPHLLPICWMEECFGTAVNENSMQYLIVWLKVVFIVANIKCRKIYYIYTSRISFLIE